MATTKLEKIASIEEEIRKLKERQKTLQSQHNEQERKARNHRLCKRGGLVEKLLPDLITLTDEQFEAFVNKTLLTDHTKRILAEMAAQGGEAATARPAEAAPQGGTGGSGNEGNGTRQGG